jgi:SAM-dependent methyltransferase
MRQVRRTGELFVRQIAGFSQSENKLIGDSQDYWNNLTNQYYKQHSHWRGDGRFADDYDWLALGQEHLRLYQEFVRALDLKHSPRRILEWGCGGGLNAVLFGNQADAYYGVDISLASLQECSRQMIGAEAHNFVPVLIDASDPEAALAQIKGGCDLFLSTYVFELLPTPGYGIRVLKIAYELLAPGGIAFIQIKYSENSWRTRSRRWGYSRNLAWNTTYRIEEFWLATAKCGFIPKMVTLVPKQPLVSDRNYAYFLLLKPTTSQPF